MEDVTESPCLLTEDKFLDLPWQIKMFYYATLNSSDTDWCETAAPLQVLTEFTVHYYAKSQLYP